MNTKTNTVSKKAGLIKIGIDMHLSNYRVVRQIDQSNPEPPQKFKPVVFFLWLAKQLGIAEEVVVVLRGGLLWVSAGAADAKAGSEGVCDRAAELG
jgi:hypothetical protein